MSSTERVGKHDWFGLARISALLYCVLVTILLIRGIPEVYASTMKPCRPENHCLERHLTADDLAALTTIGWSVTGYGLYQTLTDLVYCVVFVPLAGLIYVKLVRPATAHRWFGLLTMCILVSLATILLPLGPLVLMRTHSDWAALYRALKSIAFVLFLAFLYTFPTGRLVWRGLIGLLALAALLGVAWNMTGNPDLDPSGRYGLAISLLCTTSGVLAQIFHYRRASTEERQQTRWLIFGFLIGQVSVILWTSVFLAFPANHGTTRIVMNTVGWAFLLIGPLSFGVSLAVAILRYRLWDVDILINRTIVYTLLTALIAGIYVALVSALGMVFQTGGSASVSPLLVTGVIALSFQGLRDRIQRAVNRLMFGQRDEPLQVIERLGRQLTFAATPEDLLDSAVNTVSATLKVPYAAIYTRRAQDEVLQADAGTLHTPTAAFPLIYQNERVGTLVVGQRSPGELLSIADQAVLTNIAQQMSAVVHNVRLLIELQRSRERLVTAREEERRRLRRDLHDGLGPALASQALKIDAAVDLLAIDPDEARNLLTEIKTQSQTLVADIRRLVYELRPPALDEIGLAGALTGTVLQMRAANHGLHIAIDAPDPMPDLPAAVEVAAFRITMEAITNVVKHAGARRCQVTITVQAHPAVLSLDVEDDGKGLPVPVTSGIGMLSMRERAEELGGTFTAANQVSGGALIRVTIPVQREETV